MRTVNLDQILHISMFELCYEGVSMDYESPD